MSAPGQTANEALLLCLRAGTEGAGGGVAGGAGPGSHDYLPGHNTERSIVGWSCTTECCSH